MNGTYSDYLGVNEVVFKGNKITIKGLGISLVEGSYAIEGDKMSITNNSGELIKIYSYKKDGNSIYLDDVEFIKK